MATRQTSRAADPPRSSGNRAFLNLESLDDRVVPSSTSTWAVVGDWNGDGIKTPGAVYEVNGVLRWYLRDTNTTGGPDIAPFDFGGSQFPMQPVVGDWNGDGVDTVGAVVRMPDGRGGSVMVWFLRDSNAPGPPTIPPFAYGGGDQFWTPVVGDWDGNGTDTVGAVVATAGGMVWDLRNSNTPGPPSIAPFAFGGAAFDALGRPFWQPVVGDWNGDGVDTPGAVFRDINGATFSFWNLRNSNTSGVPDAGQFAYGAWNWDLVTGDWNNDHIDTIGAIDPFKQWHLRNSNTPGPQDIPVFFYDGSIGGVFL
jgi:hypothetical protein